MMTRTRRDIPRNNPPRPAAYRPRWRGVWCAAQISPLVFSSYVWLILAGLVPLVALTLLAAGAVMVAARHTRFGLWWRFGVREMFGVERDRVLAAIVPVGSLRGRRQPARVWVGSRMPAGLVVRPTDTDLVVSRLVRDWVMSGSHTDEQVSAVVAYGLGQQPVTRSRMVAVGEVVTMPWSLLVLTLGPVVARLGQAPLVALGWKGRWVIFAVAVWQSASEGRWVGMWGVLVIATLSWSTGFLHNRWMRRLERLGDQRVIEEGLGPVLAAMLSRAAHVTTQRLELLRGRQ